MSSSCRLGCASADVGAMRIVEMLFQTSLVALVGAGEEVRRGFHSIISPESHSHPIPSRVLIAQPTLSPRRLRLLNTSGDGDGDGGGAPTELRFVSAILAVRMTSQRLCVLLERSAFIHNLADLALLESLDTCPNPTGGTHPPTALYHTDSPDKDKGPRGQVASGG